MKIDDFLEQHKMSMNTFDILNIIKDIFVDNGLNILRSDGSDWDEIKLKMPSEYYDNFKAIIKSIILEEKDGTYTFLYGAIKFIVSKK